jgi:hypothetical protein
MKKVVVADMSDEGQTTLTTPSLMSRALGVITTPSTIALDGALSGVPVAITRYGLNLDYYFPLKLLDNLQDWHSFLDSLIDSHACELLKMNGERFLKRVIIPGDPAEKILDLMAEH